MMTDAQRVAHMIGFVMRLQEIVKDVDRDSYLGDIGLREQLEVNFIHLGEAAARLTEEFRAAHGSIEWHRIIGFRNLLTHEYFRVKPEVLYDTAVNDMPELKAKLESLNS